MLVPSVELFPGEGPEIWGSPNQNISPLFIDVHLYVEGLRLDNLTNLWHAIVRALRPVDIPTSNAFARTLQSAGAETGLILITRPALAVAPDAAELSYFTATGQVVVRIVSQ
jgi:hypothetical protein